MYSESDIDAAVTAGAISPDSAAAFRRYVADAHAAPAVDEEHFRLVTGFNDIFVSIAIVLLLVALGQIGVRLTPALGRPVRRSGGVGPCRIFHRATPDGAP